MPRGTIPAMRFDHVAQQDLTIGEGAALVAADGAGEPVVYEDDTWGLLDAHGTLLAFVHGRPESCRVETRQTAIHHFGCHGAVGGFRRRSISDMHAASTCAA